MAEVNISINGRTYGISCDDGQEGRIVDLAAYIDDKLEQIARGGGAYNDAHLLVLTALVVADELFDAQANAGRSPVQRGTQQAPAANKEEEQALARVLDQLTRRIDGIATRVEAA